MTIELQYAKKLQEYANKIVKLCKGIIESDIRFLNSPKNGPEGNSTDWIQTLFIF